MKYLIWIIILGLGMSRCQQTPEVDLQAEGEQVMETSRAWAESQTAEEYLSYWTEDAVILQPGSPAIRGHQEIMKMLKEGESIPGFAVDWEPVEVKVSKAGDMAYLLEKTSFSMNDSLGNPMTNYYKTVTIWEKQEDGSWKCVVDMFNDDPSLTSIR